MSAENRMVGIVTFHHSKKQSTHAQILQNVSAIQHTDLDQWVDHLAKRKSALSIIMAPTPGPNRRLRQVTAVAALPHFPHHRQQE